MATNNIGSYEVLGKLASGGVGAIYVARRKGPSGFQRLVAIKKLHPHYEMDVDLVSMFVDEARLAARIHHANVIPIVELGNGDDGHYVVMDYVEGTNLLELASFARRWKTKRIPRPIVMRIILDALAGLHAAHELQDDDGRLVNLVHRDVSPDNVVVGVDGTARLTDFGIARASSLRTFESRGGVVKGKLAYMAPEQLECKKLGRASDIFSMGVVLWEALTSARLFADRAHVGTMKRILSDPIPSPRSADPTIDVELERICMRALERQAVDRFITAEEFAEELHACAMKDGGVATHRDVASFVDAVMGENLRALRTAYRTPSTPAPDADASAALSNERTSPALGLPSSQPTIAVRPPAPSSSGALMEMVTDARPSRRSVTLSNRPSRTFLGVVASLGSAMILAGLALLVPVSALSRSATATAKKHSPHVVVLESASSLETSAAAEMMARTDDEPPTPPRRRARSRIAAKTAVVTTAVEPTAAESTAEAHAAAGPPDNALAPSSSPSANVDHH